MAHTFKPLADDETTLTIGGLTIENGIGRVNLSGSLDLARDRQGLDRARALRDVMVSLIAALEGEKDLPAKAATPKPASTSKKPNPFA